MTVTRFKPGDKIGVKGSTSVFTVETVEEHWLHATDASGKHWFLFPVEECYHYRGASPFPPTQTKSE